MPSLDELIANHARLVANSAESYAFYQAAQADHRADREAERKACEALDEALTSIITADIELGRYEPVGSGAGDRLAKALMRGREILKTGVV